MRILVSNDDGVDAPGIVAVAARLAREHEVWVVAPTSERSAQSHSLTMHKPLRITQRGERVYAVSGTPADCIYLGLHHLLTERPDVVVSGINRGANLGTDVHYSGTVAAAREACLHGRPAVAVSLHRDPDDPEDHWDAAAEITARVVLAMAADPLPPRVFLNVNVPNAPLDTIRGLKACRLGDRFYHPQVDERTDPRGRPYVWIGGPHAHFGDDPEADGRSAVAGWATVTPLSAAITSETMLARLRSWTDA